MKKTTKKIVILVLILFIGFNVYRFFSTGDSKTASKSNLVKTTNETTKNDTSTSTDKFLNLLLGINTINLSKDIFTKTSFRTLVDFSLKDEEQKLDLSFGRKNPFLPIGQDDGAISNPSSTSTIIKTNPATAINSSDALLNAVLLNVDNTNDQYFEWGISKTLPLGNTTASVPFSGENFSYKITNLVPNTTYYYRAVVKKDNKIFTGDILSFKTIQN